jgi:hypothetical protein
MSTTTLPGRIAAPATPGALRAGTALVLGGAIAEYAVTTQHAHREAPNDHAHVFAEYAASDNWIAVHLGQFAAGVVLLTGFVVLLSALRAAGTPAVVTRVGTAATVLAGAVFAGLQAVDGVALKHAVDSLADAPPGLRDAYFHDAEIVRWGEWAMAGYSRITLGLAVAAVGIAVLRSRSLPRWTAGPAVIAGAAFVVDGVLVSRLGFSDQVLASLVGWIALALFGLTVTVAAWIPRRRY